MSGSDPVLVSAEALGPEHLRGQEQVRGEFVYRHRFPRVFDFVARDEPVGRLKLRSLLQEEVRCPPEVVYDLKDVLLLSGKYLLLPDGSGLAPSFKDADLSPGSRGRLGELDRAEDARVRLPGGRTAVHIAKEGAANYGHTLTEIIPKLLNLKRVVSDPLEILLPQEGASLRMLYEQVAGLLGLDAVVTEVSDGSLLRFDRLVWAGPVSEYPSRKSAALLELADLLLAAAPASHRESAPRLYVDRPPGEKRRPSNGEALKAVLEAGGYRSVAPSRMSLLEQVSVFRNAEVILGPMGAGLTNSLFAPSSALVASIDPGLVDTFYWDLASLRGQQFAFIMAADIDQWRLSTLLSDYTVDVANIARIADVPIQGDPPMQAPAESGAPPPPPAPPMSAPKSSFAPCFWGPVEQDSFLAEVRRLIAPFGEGGAFAGDNMIVFGRNMSMLDDEPFQRAFNRYITPDNHVGHAIMWRLYTFCWAARSGLGKEGDFVECGVYSGTSSAIMCDYLDFGNVDKRLYLYDVWDTDDNRVDTSHYPDFDSNLFAAVSERFRPYPNVELVKGFVPDSFAKGCPERISFLHIDLNNAAAEIAALDHLFERVVPGGVILFDDYGSTGYRASKLAEDEWMARRGYSILELPTSQGLVIR